MTNPFETPTGAQGRMAAFRVLAAAGDGAVSDFAKEVVAGRASARDLLTSGWVVEQWIDDLQADAEAFRASPEAQEEWSPEEARAYLESRLTGLANLDVEAIEAQVAPAPAPPAAPRPCDEDDEQGPLLKDAW